MYCLGILGLDDVAPGVACMSYYSTGSRWSASISCLWNLERMNVLSVSVCLWRVMWFVRLSAVSSVSHSFLWKVSGTSLSSTAAALGSEAGFSVSPFGAVLKWPLPLA